MNQSADIAAVVTGGSRGIGAAIVRRLAGAGHPVAVLDIDGDAAESIAASVCASGGRAIALRVDVTEASAVAAAIDEVAERLAPPLIAVNNAGMTRDQLLFRMSEEDWDSVLGVHVKGAFLIARETQRYMVPAKWGRIVSLSSTSALGNRGQSNYSAAKAAIQGLTKTLAIELGPFGVTANAIAPGFIRTEMTARTADRLGVSFDDFIAQAASQIPVRRVGTVEDVADLTAYLVSESAGFLSGQVIYLAGGPKA